MKYKAIANLSPADVDFYIIKCGLGADKLLDREALIFEASPEEVFKLHQELYGDSQGIPDDETKNSVSWYLEPAGE